jgi:hypothetical protein
LPGGPSITFTSKEISERNLILIGVKDNVNNASLAEWLLKILGITIPESNIQIRLISTLKKDNAAPQPTEEIKPTSNYTASLFFDSKEDGKKMMIFCAKPNNSKAVSEILEGKRTVTLYMVKDK